MLVADGVHAEYIMLAKDGINAQIDPGTVQTINFTSTYELLSNLSASTGWLLYDS